MRDHQPLIQRGTRGLFSRGQEDTIPPGYLLKANNVIYSAYGIKTREGIVNHLTFPNLVRFHIYKRMGEADRLLILNSTGELYDSTNLVTPILTIAAMTDFSMVAMFNRAYITPHNGVRGLPGEFVYVYQGSGVARKAAGNPPSGFTLVVIDSAAAGNIEAGDHLFAVAFETDTGYITAPGPVSFTKYTAPGSKKAKVTAIPIGPAGTVARHILATQTITTYNGNQIAYELFFVPGGKISNNVDVELDNINFFDTDLVASADYLIDNLSELPAQLGLADYSGNMIGWGSDTQESVVRVSKNGEPESWSGIDGFVIANPADGGGVKNCVIYRGDLHIYKAQRHLMTRNNGGSPTTWPSPTMDAAVGTDTHGICQIMDTKGQTMDQYIVASRQGLLKWTGGYEAQPLSFVVDDLWKRININEFKKVQVCLDPILKRIYILAPLDGASTPSHILVCDYKDGMLLDSVKWSLWTFNVALRSVGVDTNFADQTSVLRIGASSNTYSLSAAALNDVSVAIPTPEIEYAFEPADDDDFWNHYGGIRLRVIGAGTLKVKISGLDRVETLQARDITLSSAPGNDYTRNFDFQARRACVSLSTESIDEWFHINKRVLYKSPLWVF